MGKGEWVWSEFGDSPNSPQTHMISIFSVFSLYCYLKHFFWEERNEFGVSLEVLQTSNSLQTYSKLAPNSYGFILLFLLYCQLIVFWKRNDFSFFPLTLLDVFKEKGMNLEVPQRLSNLAEGTCSYSAGTWNYIFWPLFYWNISNKPCARISPGAAKLVQVIRRGCSKSQPSGLPRLDGAPKMPFLKDPCYWNWSKKGYENQFLGSW